MADASVSSKADGALAGELRPGARPTGRVGVAPMAADVARVLQGVRGAFCEGRDKDSESSETLAGFCTHGEEGGAEAQPGPWAWGQGPGSNLRALPPQN